VPDMITVPSVHLLALLRDVQVAASTEDVLPFINGVMLHSATGERGDDRLVATATDRFCALHGSVQVSGQLSAPVYLRVAQIAQIAATLRPYTSRKRTGLAETSISVADGKVKIGQVSLDGLADVSVTFAHDAGSTFPTVPRIFTEAMGREASLAPFHVDGNRLVKFARIGAARGLSMRLQSTGENKPVLVTFDSELVGLLMPIRVGEEKSRPLVVPVYPVPVLDEAVAA
jgi:hypothetical protein